MSNSKCAGIYSITSKVNGKRYIGSAIRICIRWAQHLKDLRDNKHSNTHLQNHYNKYGKDDLLFAVVEIVERDSLSLKEFKDLLLDKEQIYLDNWEECEFNIRKKATSCLGYKKPNCKYYRYCKKQNRYFIMYKLNNKSTYFGSFDLEQDAIDQVEIIKSLTEEELFEFWKANFKCKKTYSNRKNYTYSKSKKAFSVYFNFNKVKIHFGYHEKEEDAIKEVTYLKTLLDEDKIKYYENTYKGNKGQKQGNKRKNTKGYFYSKTWKRWQVKFLIEGKVKCFGSFNTEEEAKEKANQIKKEFDWPN